MMRIMFRSKGLYWISIALAAAGAAAVAFLPWETVGAPMLSVLLFGGIAFSLAIFDSPVEERRFVIRLVLVALAVRLAAAAIFYLSIGSNETYIFSDANSYDRAAWTMARNWKTPGIFPAGMGPLEFILDDVYPLLLAGFYFLFGHSAAAAIAVNAVLGTSSVYLVYRIGAILFGPVTARWAGWLTAFYTGFWLWEMMTMKDALFIFLMSLFFLGLYRVWNFLALPNRRGAGLLRTAGWIIVLILIWAVSGELREYIPAVLACAVVLLPLANYLRTGRPRRWLLILGMAAVFLFIFWPVISARRLPSVMISPQTMLIQTVVPPVSGTVGILLTWILSHPLEFIQYLTLTTISTALAPYAWILPGTLPEVSHFETYMIMYPGMWLWYFLIPFFFLGLTQAVRRTKGNVWPLVFYGAAIFLLVAIFIPREYRHRDIVMPMALLLAAEGLVYSRKWWAVGLIVWIPLAGLITWKLHSIVPVLLAAGVAAVGLLFWNLRRKRERDAWLVKGKVT